jgi:hypothetical protein
LARRDWRFVVSVHAILVRYYGTLVMRGLNPRIHHERSSSKKMDCRVKPGNDDKWAMFALLYRDE